MADCTSHPGAATVEACQSCRRPFCAACLVDFMGGRYCGACRDVRHAQAQQSATAVPSAAEQLIPARNPMALIGYYVSVLSLVPCLGNLLGPASIVLGALGLQAIKRNPNLPGKAHALVAIILGSITSCLYWGLVILMVISASQR